MNEPFIIDYRGKVKQKLVPKDLVPCLRAEAHGNHPLVVGEYETTYQDTWTKGESNGMKVNSFFCGAGGFDLGFIQAGFDIAGAWDFDKYAVQSYNHNIGGAEQADVSQMKGEQIPKANGWLFGFPCQDISVAGKQAGMVKGETRSGLFYEIMRLLGEVSDKPEWILAENVKAVNKFIPTIEEEYDKAGYTLVSPQLYNSKYWFVPQNRERYFLLGIRKDLSKSFLFPEQQTDFIPKLSSILEENVDEKYYIDDIKAAKIIEQAIEGLKVKQATKKGYDIAVEGDTINISHPNSKTRRGRVGKQVAQTLLTGTEQVVVESLGSVHACITPDRVNKRQNGRRAKEEEEEEMFTLTSQDLHGVIIDPSQEKREGKHRIYNESSPTLNARDYKDPRMVVEQGTGEIEVIGRLGMFSYRSLDEVHATNGISPAVTCSEGGHRQPKILEEIQSVFTDKDGVAYCCDANYAKGISPGDVGNGRRTQVIEQISKETGLLHADGVGKTLRVGGKGSLTPKHNYEHLVTPQFRVRKLTPREYARLQGFPDSYEQIVSNSQFYKQMGNAITTTVSFAIAKSIAEQLHN